MRGLEGAHQHRAARRAAASDPLATLGRSSLFIYWIHVELVYGYASWMWRHRLPLWGTAIAFVAVLRADVPRDRLARPGGRQVAEPAAARRQAPAGRDRLIRRRICGWRDYESSRLCPAPGHRRCGSVPVARTRPGRVPRSAADAGVARRKVLDERARSVRDAEGAHDAERRQPVSVVRRRCSRRCTG